MKQFKNLGLSQEEKHDIANLPQKELTQNIRCLNLRNAIYEGNLEQLYEIVVTHEREELFDPDMCPEGFVQMMRKGAEYYLQCRLVLTEHLKHYKQPIQDLQLIETEALKEFTFM